MDKITQKDLDNIVHHDGEPKPKSDFNLNESRIVITVSNSMFEQLNNAASFHNFPSVESYCSARLFETLNSNVGAPRISSPSKLGDDECKPVKGPIGGIVTRG